MGKESHKSVSRAEGIFRKHGGILRTADAIRFGIHPRQLYAMRESGVIEPLTRGLFRLQKLPPLEHPDLVTVAFRIPQGVICLISALAFHDLTTQIPRTVDVAIKRGSENTVTGFRGLRSPRGYPFIRSQMSPLKFIPLRRPLPIALNIEIKLDSIQRLRHLRSGLHTKGSVLISSQNMPGFVKSKR